MKMIKFENYGNYRNEGYGAHTIMFTDSENRDIYFSYKTIVAFRSKDGLKIIENQWGPVTGKHLNWINDDKKIRLTQDEFKKAYEKEFGHAWINRR